MSQLYRSLLRLLVEFVDASDRCDGCRVGMDQFDPFASDFASI